MVISGESPEEKEECEKGCVERAVRVGGPSLGISPRFPGARRCPVYAHDSRKVECWIVWAFCRALLRDNDELTMRLFD